MKYFLYELFIDWKSILVESSFQVDGLLLASLCSSLEYVRPAVSN